jgi:hypothetical protein
VNNTGKSQPWRGPGIEPLGKKQGKTAGCKDFSLITGRFIQKGLHDNASRLNL